MPTFLDDPRYTSSHTYHGADYGYIVLAEGSYMTNDNVDIATLALGDLFDYRQIFVDGTIIATRGRGVQVGDDPTHTVDIQHSRVTVSDTGSVHTYLEAVVSNSNYFSLLNHGTLESYSETAVELVGTFADVENFGTIVSQGGYGLTAQQATGSSIVNYADIFGANTAIDLASSDSVFLLNAGRIVGNSGIASVGQYSNIRNTGEIIGTHAYGITIVENSVSVINDGVIQSANATLHIDSARHVNIVNSGTMASESTAMTFFSYDGDETSFELTNSGSIIGGDGVAISAFFETGVTDASSARIVNSGEIIGDLNFARNANAGGEETITNTGLIIGDIDLGAQNDVYAGGNGTIEGIVSGGQGNDTLRGGSEDNLLNGDEGNDVIRGAAGEDEINGGDGNDALLGGRDDDILFGDAGIDTLRGGTGDDGLSGGGGRDFLFGGLGDDDLRGGLHDDQLSGGRGDDILTGDLGRDVFIIRPFDGNDTITDFTNGADRIDLSAFALGAAGFASLVAPSLSAVGPNSTLLEFGTGSLLIQGLSLVDADASDFIFT